MLCHVKSTHNVDFPGGTIAVTIREFEFELEIELSSVKSKLNSSLLLLLFDIGDEECLSCICLLREFL